MLWRRGRSRKPTKLIGQMQVGTPAWILHGYCLLPTGSPWFHESLSSSPSSFLGAPLHARREREAHAEGGCRLRERNQRDSLRYKRSVLIRELSEFSAKWRVWILWRLVPFPGQPARRGEALKTRCCGSEVSRHVDRFHAGERESSSGGPGRSWHTRCRRCR
jgi:hypothetical protein